MVESKFKQTTEHRNFVHKNKWLQIGVGFLVGAFLTTTALVSAKDKHDVEAVVIKLGIPQTTHISAAGVDLSPVGKVNIATDVNTEDAAFEMVEIPKHISGNLPASVYKRYKVERDCLATNIYFEARGQYVLGQLAVGIVTLNRVVSKKYPSTICKVVWQKKRHKKSGKWVAQFSWTLDKYSNNPKKKSAAYKEAIRLAELLLDRDSGIIDFTQGATHYHATYVNPDWANKLTMLGQYDDHIFYIE